MTLAIIGFDSSYTSSAIVTNCSDEVRRIIEPGHVALKFESKRVYGFLPEQIPTKLDIRKTYPGRWQEQTDDFAMLEGIVRIEEFPLDVGWREAVYITRRLQAKEYSPYRALAPSRGPPYNCISFLRDVGGIELPKTNSVRSFLRKMRKEYSTSS